MKRRSPTLEGFKLMFRRPSFGLAEVTWRWSFGAAATALLGLSFLEYLDTLPVSRRDMLLLSTRQPALIGRAIAHIFAGSGARFVAASIVLGLTLALAWVVVASWGRAVTLKSLLGYFWKEPSKSFPFKTRALFGLNFFRAGVALAAIVGCVGAVVLGSIASSEKDPSPGSAMLIFLSVVMLAWSAWATVNWVLSLASVFVVTHNEDTFGAIAAAVGLIRERSGAVFAASTWFGLAHLVALSVFSSVIAFPLAFAGVLPGGVVLGGVLLVTLLYFALADFLYLGRLGSYVWIVEGPEIEPVQETVMEPPSGQGTQGNSALIEILDPNELILSDVPIV